MRGGLQQLEHVGEDAHVEHGAHRPRAQRQEAAQDVQRAHAVQRAQQHLQHHGQLVGRRLARAQVQPQPEGGELVAEEGRVAVVLRVLQERRQLRQRQVQRVLPRRPQRVARQRRQGGRRHRRAVVRPETPTTLF